MNRKLMTFTKCGIYLLFIILFFGCSKSDDENYFSFSEEQFQEIEKNIEKLENRISELAIGTKECGDLLPYVEEISNMEGVKHASVEDDALIVELECGITLGWLYVENFKNDNTAASSYYMAPMNIMRAGGESAVEGAELMEEDAKMCIINAVSEDEDITDYSATKTFSELAQSYSKAGYSVTAVNGRNFNQDFINNELSKYQIIAMLAHGFYYNGLHWIVTGEHWSLRSLISAFTSGFLGKNNILLQEVDENYKKGSGNISFYVAISEKYLSENLQNFKPNSILFAMTCLALKRNDSLWNVLKRKGLGVFVGYDERIGSWYAISAMSMFYNNLLSYRQSTTSKAFESIVPSLREYRDVREENGVVIPYVSHICYRSQRDICLFKAEEISNDEVVDLGLSVKWRNCNIGAQKPIDKGTFYSEWDYFRKGLNDYKDLIVQSGYNDEVGELSGSPLDPAKNELGGSWRLPTSVEMKELLNKCKWEEIVMDGTPGFKVIGPNNNSIFLPAVNFFEVDSGFTGFIYTFTGSYFSGTYFNGMQGLVFSASVGPEVLQGTTPYIAVEDSYAEGVVRPVCP